MQRADKVALIVASVLVVLLAAGSAFLLVKRNDTLAGERPLDDAVKLTKFEESPTPVPAVKPAKQVKPTVPKQPTGYDFGYVARISGTGKALTLRWDRAELLTGKEADLFAKKRGAVLNTQPYYIANDTKKYKTYDVWSKAPVVIPSSDGTTKTITPAQLKQQLGAYASRPWFAYIVDGVVRRLVLVVLPPATAQ